MISIAELEARSKQLEKEINRIIHYEKPGDMDEKLVVRRGKNGKYKYYASHKEDGKVKERYLSAEYDNYINKMSFYEYNAMRLKDAIEEKEAIDKFLSYLHKEKHLSRFMSAHPGHIEKIQDWVSTQGIESLTVEEKNMIREAEQWKKKPYIRSNEHPEQLTKDTIVPELKVRSKSESLIVSVYETRHVAYHYEEELKLLDENGNEIILHPDFICMNMRTHGIVIHEHLGLADDESYMEKVYWRENIYRLNGFYPWKNLIYTTEIADSTIDLNWLNTIVDYWMT